MKKAIDDLKLNSLVQKIKNLIDQNVSGHADRKDNPHEVTKAQVGLDRVDNTNDSEKPISVATQKALDDKVDDSEVSVTPEPNKLLKLDSNGQIPRYILGEVEPVNIDVTLLASGWKDNIYTIKNENINKTNNGVIYLAQSVSDEQCLNTISSIIRIFEQDEGILKLKCVVTPSVDIPIVISLYE